MTTMTSQTVHVVSRMVLVLAVVAIIFLAFHLGVIVPAEENPRSEWYPGLEHPMEFCEPGAYLGGCS